MSPTQTLTRNDILPLDEFEKVRAERRSELIAMKRNRRVAVGPDATFYFENRDTMWWQIHEMLRIEKGGEEQIADELAAYAPLVPTGSELVATVMFEIDDPVRRDRVLRSLGGIEDTFAIEMNGGKVRGVPELQDGVERTTADGKTSSIHFVRFPFTAEQIAKFHDPAIRAVLAIEHDNYAHMAVLTADVKQALSSDFAA
jgi:hypothetical protein